MNDTITPTPEDAVMSVMDAVRPVHAACPICGASTTGAELDEAAWLPQAIVERLVKKRPSWKRGDGACPTCIHEAVLQALTESEGASHDGTTSSWPLNVEREFGALPTPIRLHADGRYTGRGVTLALVDAGFYPHPDLTAPANRIRAWVDAAQDPPYSVTFHDGDPVEWPGWDAGASSQWHGLMTSCVAAGAGSLSHGLYRSLACEAGVVLVQVRDEDGAITNESIARALRWLGENGPALGVQVVNVSLGGEEVSPLTGNPVDVAVDDLTALGMTVVVAAGNDGVRRLVPPATAPAALTVGGLDDHDLFDAAQIALWHSNYGQTADGMLKPELTAPSVWVVAPLLPHTDAAAEALALYQSRTGGDDSAEVEERIAAESLVSPYYKFVEGTSFASPLVASVAVCMLQANPSLTPALLRALLIAAARPIPDALQDRQGAGAVDAGQAVTLALHADGGPLAGRPLPPYLDTTGVSFALHDVAAHAVEVVGSWNEWQTPGFAATKDDKDVWSVTHPPLDPGTYAYRFLIDGERWQDDPANPRKVPDGYGGFNSVLIVPEEKAVDGHPVAPPPQPISLAAAPSRDR